MSGKKIKTRICTAALRAVCLQTVRSLAVRSQTVCLLTVCLLTVCLLTGCAGKNNDVDDTAAVSTEQTEQVTSAETKAAVTEAPVTEASEAVTTARVGKNPLERLASYKSENAVMQAICGLAAASDGNIIPSACQYMLCDMNGSRTDKFAMIFPDSENGGYAFYVIDEDGETSRIPLSDSAKTKEIYASADIYRRGVEFFFHLYTHTNTTGTAYGVQTATDYYMDSSFEVIKSFSAIKTPTVDSFAEDGEKCTYGWYEHNKREREFPASIGIEAAAGRSFKDLSEYFDKPEELEKLITERAAMTPLQKAEQYCKNNNEHRESSILYDITGDGFPELISVFAENYIDLYYGVFDMGYDGYPQSIFSGYLDNNSKIYFCEDENGHRFIVSAYCEYGLHNYSYWSAERFDIYDDGSVEEKCIGEAEVYSDYKAAYNVTLEFDGADCKALGYLTKDNEEEEVSEEFYSLVENYVSRYTVLDEITVDYYGGNGFKYNGGTEFRDFPEINNAPAGAASSAEMINVCGTLYPADSRCILIYKDEIDGDLDTDILNSFPYLSEVHFGGVRYGEERAYTGERLVISPSDWCGKVKRLHINTDIYDIDGGFGCFKNVNCLYLSGKHESLDFITEMPSIEAFAPYFDIDDPDMLKPLTELPKLAVIVDSGIDRRIKAMPEDLDCIWAGLK